MGLEMKTKSVFLLTGSFINEALSLVVFLLMDFLDFVLCFVYKIIDFIVEAEWKPCYCSSAKEVNTRYGKVILSDKGQSKQIVCVTSRKLHLEEISDTLYTRPSFLSEVSKLTVKEIKKLKVEKGFVEKQHSIKSCKTVRHVNGTMTSSMFTMNSSVVGMLQGKTRRELSRPVHRWSDCDCSFCAAWTFSSKDTLYVRSQGPKDHRGAKEDVLFIHGFISSSSFWSETVFPNFSKSVKSTYRLFAADLLGFGQSPKPADSMYTLREHC